MNFSKVMIEKAKTASSAEELMRLAAEEGIELSAAEAETYFSFLKDNGPLSDEELERVAGGKGKPDPPPPPSPKYYVGQHLWQYYESSKNYLHLIITKIAEYAPDRGYKYYFFLPDLQNPHITWEWLDIKEVYTYNPKP